MLIIWGEKIRRDRRGFCANYCGLCKEPVAFEVAMMLGFGAWVLLLLFFIFLGEHLAKLGVISSLMQSTGLDGFGLGMVTMLVSGVAILIWATATYKSRYFKKNVYPQLATSLAPLRPTHDELESVRTMLKSNGLQMGKVSVDKLEAALLERQGR